jgi:threonine/homoserine/homoserine lactone efflux protein
MSVPCPFLDTPILTVSAPFPYQNRIRLWAARCCTAFAVIKYAGALYFFWLGVRVVRSRNMPMDEASPSTASSHAFRQGVATEVLNPKTALFFLSFLPQFVNPHLGHVVIQFLLLGVMSVSLNTTADLLVVSFAALGTRLRSSARFRGNQRVASGVAMMGLGAFVYSHSPRNPISLAFLLLLQRAREGQLATGYEPVQG